VDDRATDWDTRLAAAEFAINNASSASTRTSPFFLNYGFHPLMPTTMDISSITGNKNQGAIDFATQLETDLKSAKELLHQAQERQKRSADLKLQDRQFQVGDQVLLSTKDLNIKDSSKLNAKWVGPFKVLEIVSPLALRLELPTTMKIHPVIHVSRLKSYHTSLQHSGREPPKPPPIIGEDIYLAERILDKRLVRRGRQRRPEYLIQWHGYPIYEAT
jgi:hypothetical protein